MIALSHIATGLAFAGVGVIAGYLHLRLLSWNIRSLMEPARGSLVIVAPLIRGAITVAAFSAAALQGALPLVAALVGFLVARTVVLRRPEAPLR